MRAEDGGTFRLSLCTRLAFSVGHVFNDLCAAMWFTYLLVFLQRIAGFSHLHSGMLLFWGQLVDALCTPVIGYLSDGYSSVACSCARQKVWHIIGTVFVLFSFPSLFTYFADIHGTTTELSSILQCGLVIAIFQFGWAATQVSHLALIPQLTTVDSERTELSAFRTAWTVLSNVAVYALAWFLFLADQSSTEVTALNFTNLTVGVVVIGIFFTVIFYVFVRAPMDSPIIGSATSLSSAKQGCGSWFKEFHFYQVALIYTCSRLIVNVSQTYWPMYLSYTLRLSKQYIAIVPLVVSGSGFFTSLFMRRIISKTGHKYLCAFVQLICILGLLMTVFSCVSMWYLDEVNSKLVFVPAFLNGTVGSILLVTSLSMTNNLIGYRLDSSAFVFGVMSFADKLANGVCIVLIQQYHPCGWSASECLDAALYYRDVMVIFPVAVAVVCFTAICCTSSNKFLRHQ